MEEGEDLENLNQMWGKCGLILPGELHSEWKANAFYNGSQMEERGDQRGRH